MNKSALSTGAGAILLAATMGLCATILASHFVPAFQGTDENGYVLSAQRMARYGDSAKYQADPLEFVSGNWVEPRENVYYAKYPLGYPWLGAVAYRLGGPAAVFLVNPVLAVLAVLGIFLLGRSLAGDFAGALAALLLATNPLHLLFGISSLSHTGSVCFAIWGMWLVWRWSEYGGWVNAALAGILIAGAVTVRYTEALLALPAAAMVLWRLAGIRRSAPEDRGRSRMVCAIGQATVMLLAGGATLAPLLVHHQIAFGSPWTTGYSLCGEATGFGWKWFVKNWDLTLGRMNSPGLILLFPLGIAGLVHLAVTRAKPALFLGLWVMPALLVYTAYYWAPQGEGWGYLRFFVSIFPPLILSALMLLLFAFRSRPFRTVAVGLVVLLAAVASVPETLRQMGKLQEGLLFAKTLSDLVHEKLDSGAVIVSQEHILNFLEYGPEYRLYAQNMFERAGIKSRIKVLGDSGPHPFQRRKAERIVRRAGKRNDVQLNAMLGDLLAGQIGRGRRAAIVAPVSSLSQWRGRLGGQFQIRPVAECADARTQPDGTSRSTLWAIYSIQPRTGGTPASRDPAELEVRIDQLRFQAGALRRQYQEQYPGAREQMARITDLDKQVRELQEEQKHLRARSQPPQRPRVRTAPTAPLAKPAGASAGAATTGSGAVGTNTASAARSGAASGGEHR